MTKGLNGTGRENRGLAGAAITPFVWAGALALWLVPVIAQGVSAEMNWSFADFALFAGLLAVLAGTLAALLRSTQSWPYRFGVMLAATAAVLCFLANGAVGLVGPEGALANMPFTLLPVLVLIACAATRRTPKPMAACLMAAAAAQMVWAFAIPAIGLIPDSHLYWRDAALAGFGFGGLWLAAAALLRKA